MEARMVKQFEPFSKAELEILEFLPEELTNIEVELIPSLESLPPEKVAKNLEVYFESVVGAAVALSQLGVELGKTIASAVKSSRNRGGFVKNLMNSAFYTAGQRYNVMVCNLSLNYIDQLNGVKFYQSAVYDGVTYGIWIFESGQFTNKGDGGWINWAFRGRYQRNGGYVRFSKP
jgi:hypothetical protein